MPKITDITRQKKREGFYSIFVDDTFSFSLSDLTLSLSSLKIGDELSDSELEQWRQQSVTAKAYAAALHYLSYRERTVVEVQRQLRKKEFDEAAIEQVVERLQSENLLNDARFAGQWIQMRQSISPRSRRQLELELRQHGIDANSIEIALSEAASSTEYSPDVEAIVALITKKRLQQRYTDKQKLIQYLAQKGFGYTDIKQALELLDEA